MADEKNTAENEAPKRLPLPGEERRKQQSKKNL